MTTKQSTTCAGTCQRQVRPNGERQSAWPGTVRWYARNMCEPCYTATDHPKQNPVRPCAGCQHPTRPKQMRSADAPGTRVRDGELCRPCYEAGSLVTPERARYVAGELIAYLRSRGRELEPKLLRSAA